MRTAAAVPACSVHLDMLPSPGPLLAQTAEMQKTLGELKEAIGTLEKGNAAAVEAPPDTVTLAQLRSELRVLATSLNECVPMTCLLLNSLFCKPAGAGSVTYLAFHLTECWLLLRLCLRQPDCALCLLQIREPSQIRRRSGGDPQAGRDQDHGRHRGWPTVCSPHHSHARAGALREPRCAASNFTLSPAQYSTEFLGFLMAVLQHP